MNIKQKWKTFLSYAGFPQYDPEEMDPKTYRQGKGIGMLLLERKQVDRVVAEMRKRSGERVDWHYMGGRSVVRTLGDRDKMAELMYEIAEEFYGSSSPDSAR